MGILAMCGARRIVHDYSKRDNKNILMKYNGSDGIILIRKDGVWIWQGRGFLGLGIQQLSKGLCQLLLG